MKVFVTGIGTGVGKTVVSAILCEAFEADYWKPVQSGNLNDTDSDWVKRMISNSKSVIHPEAYRLKLAASPHYAAAAENQRIELKRMQIPRTPNHLVVEGAGGVLVPLNSRDLYADWVDKRNLPVILVSRHYLGSINHTLLSVEALRTRGIRILGIIFNGNEEKATEQIIMRIGGLKMLGRVKKEKLISRKVVSAYAKEFRIGLSGLFR